MIYYTKIESPHGPMTAVSKNGALCALWFSTQPGIDLSNARRKDDEPVLLSIRAWLEAYFQGKKPTVNIPMSPEGTPFQRRVWALLQAIPYGESVTYGSLASSFSEKRMSAQAVGQAVGRNPIAILIPCHRVLGKAGKLTGYTGGLDIKTFLLDLESIPYV